MSSITAALIKFAIATFSALFSIWNNEIPAIKIGNGIFIGGENGGKIQNINLRIKVSNPIIGGIEYASATIWIIGATIINPIIDGDQIIGGEIISGIIMIIDDSTDSEIQARDITQGDIIEAEITNDRIEIQNGLIRRIETEVGNAI